MKPQILSAPIANAESHLFLNSSSRSCSDEPEPPADAKSIDRSPAPPPARASVESAALNSPPRPPGRPTLFTEALVDQICDYIQNTGVSDSAAGLLAGVSTTTLSRWKAENPDFAILLEAARAELQRELITAVREARRRDGSSDWRGAAWLLERLFPEDFGRRPRAKAPHPSPQSEESSPTVSSVPSPPSNPTTPTIPTARNPAPETNHPVEATVAVAPEPQFPKQIPPSEPARVLPPPVTSNEANLSEAPDYLPPPRRFRCARITPGIAADARDRGAEPAEAPQLFPKFPASPFPPFPNPQAPTSILIPKPNLHRPTPLTGPIIPPVLTTAALTIF